MSRETFLPAQDVYTVADLVNHFGYTRQSIAKAIRAVCPNASKDGKAYRLTLNEALAVANYYSITVNFDSSAKPSEETNQQSEADKEMIEYLLEQIKAKDEQIQALNENLKTMTENSLRLSETITELTATTKALAANATMHTAKQMQEKQEEKAVSIVPQNQSRSFLDKLKDLFS